MPLPSPRAGDSLPFSVYPSFSAETTLGDPEKIVWSSIRHLCSQRACEWYAWQIHKISNKATRSAVARNVKLYIQQASEFYEAATDAKPNTAPLFYYYSFLNLAKALCEVHHPRLHKRAECYTHGLSWKPHPMKRVSFPEEKVSIVRRGVWHLLWEVFMQEPCPAANPTRLSVMALFSFCPETSAEFDSIFGRQRKRVHLDLDLMYDKKSREAWLRFSAKRYEIRETGLSAAALLAQMSTPRTTYVEVGATEKDVRTFESATAAKVRGRATPYSALLNDIRGLNLITNSGDDVKLDYSFPLQKGLPLRMPQLMVSYTLLFWLGSLVRYDPHSVHDLMDSPYWILVDGFMTQTRLWLLELFQWAFYQRQTILRSAR